MPSAKRFARLDQLFSQLGYGSRREAQKFMHEGRIQVEGVDKLSSEMRVDPSTVKIDGEAFDNPDGLLVMVHKPTGYVCSHDAKDGTPVYELLPARWMRRSPKMVGVGRLDKDTSGLYLITDQHELVHALTSPKRHVEKTYEVTLDKEIPENAAEIFSLGRLMLRGETKPCLPASLEILSPTQARVKILEGRYHQVRRMFAAIGVHVVKLHRSHFGPLDLGELPEGQHRVLSLNSLTLKPEKL